MAEEADFKGAQAGQTFLIPVREAIPHFSGYADNIVVTVGGPSIVDLIFTSFQQRLVAQEAHVEERTETAMGIKPMQMQLTPDIVEQARIRVTPNTALGLLSVLGKELLSMGYFSEAEIKDALGGQLDKAQPRPGRK
jgi:hypothetical protein